LKKALDSSRLDKDAENMTFKFLAMEIQWNDFLFDPDVIDEVYLRIEELKSEYDGIEKLTS
jgi:hypothetical protein